MQIEINAIKTNHSSMCFCLKCRQYRLEVRMKLPLILMCSLGEKGEDIEK